MTIRVFLNCAAKVRHADSRVSDLSSFGPWARRRCAASLLDNPSAAVARWARASSTESVCQLGVPALVCCSGGGSGGADGSGALTRTPLPSLLPCTNQVIG